MSVWPSPADQVLEAIEQARNRYNRLVLVVGPPQSGKTTVLREIAAQSPAGMVNLNLELSRSLLALSRRERAIELPRFFSQVLAGAGRELVLLDNLELLFLPDLRQDPLRLLQSGARNRTIVAAWEGEISDGYLTYARLGHPEHRSYPTDDLLIVPTT